MEDETAVEAVEEGTPSIDELVAELQGQETPEEAQPEQEAAPEEAQEEAEEAPQQRKLSSAYEELARRDRELRHRMRELKEKQEAVEELNSLRDLVKRDPAAAAKKLGLDPWKLVESSLGEEEPDPVKQKLSEVDTLKQELQELKQAQQQAQQQQILSAEYGKIGKAISTLSEEAPLVAQLAADNPQAIQAEILEAARISYQETGEVPLYTDLVRNAEEALTEQYRKSIERVRALEKFKDLWGESPAAATKQPAVAQPKATKKPPATLTNDMGAESAARETRKLSPQEIEEELIRELQEMRRQHEEQD